MWKRLDRDARELIDDCEHVLSGTYVEHLRSGQRRVPRWAWVNLLAHGSEDDLRTARSSLRAGALASEWERARSFLAGEVLLVVDAGTTLTRLQATALIPLELELAADPRTAIWPPTRLVRAVTAALADAAGQPL